MSQEDPNERRNRACEGCTDNRLGERLKRAYRMVFRSTERPLPCQLPDNRLAYCRQVVRSPPKSKQEFRECEELLERVSEWKKL